MPRPVALLALVAGLALFATGFVPGFHLRGTESDVGIAGHLHAVLGLLVVAWIGCLVHLLVLDCV